MRAGSAWTFVRRGLPFFAICAAGTALAYRVQQLRFELSSPTKNFVSGQKLRDSLKESGIQLREGITLEKIYEEVSELDSDTWENIRGPREGEDNTEYLKLNVSAVDHRVSSSGDFSETPPPPPGLPNTSREAVQGSERTPALSSPAESELPIGILLNDSLTVQLVADPVSHNQHIFVSSSTIDQSQTTQPISDPGSTSGSVLDTAIPLQPFYLPSVPDFSQETVYITADTSRSVTDNLSDSSSSLPKVAGASSAHPADPENKEDLIDRTLLASIVELGFEESISILAISKTKGIGGAEAAINWILEHSNESDFDSDYEEVNNMGGAQSSSSSTLFGQFKMVLVVNMSLKMGTGKLAAQVGHATLGVYKLAHRCEEGQRALDSWRQTGEMKVVVKCQDTETLLDLFKQAKDNGLFAYVVSDAGRTQIAAGSRTVLAIFGESERVNSVTGQLKLL